MPATDCIGKLIYNGKILGTGFIAHGSGLVATSYHVVAKVGDPPIGKKLTFRFLDGSHDLSMSVTHAVDRKHDVALLRVVGRRPSGIAVAKLLPSSTARPNVGFHTRGYGYLDDPNHTYDDLSAAGQIAGTSRK